VKIWGLATSVLMDSRKSQNMLSKAESTLLCLVLPTTRQKHYTLQLLNRAYSIHGDNAPSQF
jgi:hypothetical protein